MNEQTKEPFIGIFAVSKRKGLLPTWGFSNKAGCYVPQAPFRACDFGSIKSLVEVLSDYLASDVPEVDMTFDDVRKSRAVQVALGVSSSDEVQKATVSMDVEVGADSYDLVSLRRASNGRWDSNEPYALNQKIPKEQGLEAVAQAIVDHIQSRKDLPDERVIEMPPSIAKGA